VPFIVASVDVGRGEGPRKTTAKKSGPHPLLYYLYSIEIERDSLEIRIENKETV
jgi:hypothetical protein